MKDTDQSINKSETWAELSDCTLCPRKCHVNRNAGEIGYCGQNARLAAARAALHFWEEPCLSGTNGSGAVFSAAVTFAVCTARITKLPTGKPDGRSQ